MALSAAWVNPIVEVGVASRRHLPSFNLCASLLQGNDLQVINKCWGNELTIQFFQTGKFTWPSFFKKEWSWQYAGGRPPCDFIGLNYYGRGELSKR